MRKTRPITAEEARAEYYRLVNQPPEPKPCPLCRGMGKLEPDPHGRLLEVGEDELGVIERQGISTDHSYLGNPQKTS